MGTKLGRGIREVEILKWHEKHSPGSIVQFTDPQQALRFLREYAGDPLTMRSLRNILADVPGYRDLAHLKDHIVLDRLSRLLASGRLKAASAAPAEWSATGGAVAPPPAPKEKKPAPLPPTQKGDFIIFKVVDNDTGKPLTGVKLKVKLTTGQVGEFTTDWRGTAEIRGIPSGACDIDGMSYEELLEVVEVG
jgi:hypothetical protein